MPVGQLGSLNFANLVTCGHSLINVPMLRLFRMWVLRLSCIGTSYFTLAISYFRSAFRRLAIALASSFA